MMPGRFSLLLFAVTLVTAAAKDEAHETVAVLWPGGHQSPGVAIAKSFWIVTVVSEAIASESDEPTLMVGEQQSSAKVLYYDPGQHLCLIKAEKPFENVSVFELASSPLHRRGAQLKSLSSGGNCRSTLAGKDWSYRGEQLDMPLLRVRVEEGEFSCEPGTPLVNEQGQIEGILTDRELAASNEAHAIPASRIRKVIHDMEHYQRTGKVWFGLLVHEESSTPEVIDVVEGSPADMGGIESGDVVLSLNQHPIEDFADLVEAVHNLPAGEKATLEILRGLTRKEIEITPKFPVAAKE